MEFGIDRMVFWSGVIATWYLSFLIEIMIGVAHSRQMSRMWVFGFRMRGSVVPSRV